MSARLRAVVLLAVVCVPVVAGGATLSLGVTGGLTRPDAAREPWHWDLAPRAAWGARATLGDGPLALGARVERVESRQSLALPAPAPASLAVHGTAVEALARVTLMRRAGFAAVASAAAGRTRWSWAPDQVSFDTGTGTTDVAFTPVDAPSWAFGGGLSRGVGGWTVGASAERRFTRMDSAHRAGDGVVLGTETFGDWCARLELSREWGLGRKERSDAR
ncbi:MAG: hypothetical protein U0704_12685 [Candidatus Eisenbacteria bacterium]